MAETMGNFLLNEVLFSNVTQAVAVIVAGLIIAKLLGKIFGLLLKKQKVSYYTVDSAVRSVELFVFVVSLIIALSVLKVSVAEVLISKVMAFIPSVVIFFLVFVLGYILVTLIADALSFLFIKFGSDSYLEEFGISKQVISAFFLIVKFFLLLIVLMLSFSTIGIDIGLFQGFFNTLITAIIVLALALFFFGFKEIFENFFSGLFIQKNLIKPGQQIKIGNELGEVIGVDIHGVMVRLASGYNLVVPNKEFIKKEFYLKRARSDISKLESIRAKFVPQMNYFCGPASASMMLSFFGYNFSQQEIGKLAGTVSPGGTKPLDLIKAVEKLSNNLIKGQLIRYNQIYNLRDEVKSWISDSAMILMWYKKPVLFPSKKSRSGHFVLCAGVEGDELILMDPSPQTAGVYLVDYRLMDEAMSETDKKRGYLVFAKKGTPAFWRINEGLIYANVASYKNLSKSFERYVHKLIRRKSVVNELLSEFVFNEISSDPEKKIKKIWIPEKSLDKKKNESDGSDAVND
ncbi:MAG: C39 family peptidase [archaeon]